MSLFFLIISRGLSNVQIQALTIKGTSKEAAKSTHKELEGAYDTGLVNLMIHAVAQRIKLSNGVTVTKLTLIEQITEV